ncbi:hypothetical protein QBC39DRAFT_351385 [Podospora conica]|nr:hypothetical protein QBC39DRAFT_351385 [Schizothecium conicum]
MTTIQDWKLWLFLTPLVYCLLLGQRHGGLVAFCVSDIYRTSTECHRPNIARDRKPPWTECRPFADQRNLGLGVCTRDGDSREHDVTSSYTLRQ